eukprot:s27_g45.t1
MAYQNKNVAFAGSLRIAKNSHGALCAFFVPPATPEPQFEDFRVMDVQVLKGHLKERSRGDLFKLCTEHGVACQSGASKSDLIRALCDACIAPVGLDVRSTAFGSMTPAEKEESRRIIEAKLQKNRKSQTASETKQLIKVAKKMFEEIRKDPKMWEAFQSMSFEEWNAIKEKFVEGQIEGRLSEASGVSSGNEESVTYDEADEPVGVDDGEVTPSGMSKKAIMQKRITDAFGEGQLQEISVQKHNEDVVIFTGQMPTSRMTAQQLLDELCDLQRVDADTVMLCNRRGDRIDSLTILADYIGEEGSTIYLRPSGLAGGGYGRGIPKTKKSTTSKKKSGYKRMMDEFIDEFKDVPANEHITFRTQAEEAMSIFYQEAEVDALGAFEKAFSQMSLPALKVAIEATASDSGGDTDSKLKRLSVLMYGKPIEDAKEINDITAGLLEGAELTTCTAFHSDEDISLKSLRALLQKFHDKKEGALEASQMET